MLQTVATVLRKEQLGYEMVVEQEHRQGWQYSWVLLLREDAHWFAPLKLRHFRHNVVHGRDCALFGGWNDSLWLIWRQALAQLMLNSFDELYRPHLDLRCWRWHGNWRTVALGFRMLTGKLGKLTEPLAVEADRLEGEEGNRLARLFKLRAVSSSNWGYGV